MSIDNKTQGEEFDLSGMSPEEIMALAKEKGVELTDEQLESVVGGSDFWGGVSEKTCPACGSHDVSVSNVGSRMFFRCKKCGKEWQ